MNRVTGKEIHTMMQVASSGEGLVASLKRLYGEDRFNSQYDRLQRVLSGLDKNFEMDWTSHPISAERLDQKIQESRFEEWQHPVSAEFHVAQYLWWLINGEVIPWKYNREGEYTRSNSRWHDEVTARFSLPALGAIHLFYVPETRKFRICNGHLRTSALLAFFMQGGLDSALASRFCTVGSDVEIFTTNECFLQRSIDLNTSFRSRRQYQAMRRAILKKYPNLYDKQGALS